MARLTLQTARKTRRLLKTSRRHRCGVGWWPDTVRLAGADANKPIDHQGEWKDGEDRQEYGSAQENGKNLLLAEEKRACRDEKPKAHAPEVTRDSLSTRKTTAGEHPNVSGGGEQEDDAEEEAHACGNAGGRRGGVKEGVNAERYDGDCSADPDEKCGPIRQAQVSATAGEPGSGYHVEGDDAANDVAGLGFEDRETEAA